MAQNKCVICGKPFSVKDEERDDYIICEGCIEKIKEVINT